VSKVRPSPTSTAGAPAFNALPELRRYTLRARLCASLGYFISVRRGAALATTATQWLSRHDRGAGKHELPRTSRALTFPESRWPDPMDLEQAGPDRNRLHDLVELKWDEAQVSGSSDPQAVTDEQIAQGGPYSVKQIQEHLLAERTTATSWRSGTTARSACCRCSRPERSRR